MDQTLSSQIEIAADSLVIVGFGLVMVKATSEKSSGFYRVKGESIHIRTENNSSAVVTVLGRQTQLTMLGTNSGGPHRRRHSPLITIPLQFPHYIS